MNSSFKAATMLSVPPDIGNVADYSTALVQPTAAQVIDQSSIRQLGPSRASWVLVPVLESAGGWNALLVAGAKVQLSLYLFNKENGELYWKGAASGSAGAAGLLDVLVLELSDKQTLCLQLASQAACKSLPKRRNSMSRGGGDWLAYQDKIRSAPDLLKISVTLPIDGRARARQDKPFDAKAYQDEIVKRVAKKGYESIPVSGFGLPTPPTEEQVVLANTEFGKSLSCVGTRYVLIPVVDAERGGNQKTHDISMYLFDTVTGEMVWEGSGANPGGIANSIITVLREGFPKRSEMVKSGH